MTLFVDLLKQKFKLKVKNSFSSQVVSYQKYASVTYCFGLDFFQYKRHYCIVIGMRAIIQFLFNICEALNFEEMSCWYTSHRIHNGFLPSLRALSYSLRISVFQLIF
jgi:hypothetical protein